MKKFELQETKFSPHILLDKENNILSLKGRSIPNNASELYQPVINWLIDYKNEPNQNTTLEIQLEYFNTSTHKFLVEMLTIVEQIEKSDKLIKWIYEKEDDDLLEIGKRLKGYLDLDFEFIPIDH